MKTYYKADSIRKSNTGQSDSSTFGKFCACVNQYEPAAHETDDCDGWMAKTPGVMFGSFATYDEALTACCRALENDGWTLDEGAAWDDAKKMAAKRHNLKCGASGAYKKKYGGTVTA